jgi:hypothetical protein
MWVLMYDYMLFNSAILVLQNWCVFVSNFGIYTYLFSVKSACKTGAFYTYPFLLLFCYLEVAF